jgi:predicted glycogen debranching enzyme
MINLTFGREICNHLSIAESREWLVTNGIGGYASGTIAGVLTRRYHGLLMAALKPPVARYLLLTKLDESVSYNGELYELFTNRWSGKIVTPQGYVNIESFYLDGNLPVWNYAFADGILEKRVWMEYGENTTYIRYYFKRGCQDLHLSLKALVNYRDYHNNTVGNDLLLINKLEENYLEIENIFDCKKLYLTGYSESKNIDFNWDINNVWYRNFYLNLETYHGLNDIDEHLLAVTGKAILHPGDSLTIIASTESKIKKKIFDYDKNKLKNRELIKLFTTQNKLENIPNWISQLVLAADQFIVNRPLNDNPNGQTIIAGYPWFTDWGRDTMISLTGLTITTGREAIAKNILATFAKYLDQGMLPNMFPDQGETPVYNTVDAILWYFEALRSYYCATEDQEFLAQLFPLLTEVIEWHIKGTRYQIKMDQDGLLYAGEDGVQLTWMDAKVGNWVVTPRIGKPVEINALWYNALMSMEYFCQILGQNGTKYAKMLENMRSHFPKFWCKEGGYCYDVIDTPQGNDNSFRPNQIFAVSLPSVWKKPLLDDRQRKMVVDSVAQKLLTSLGLRSLDPHDPNYQGIYGGDQLQRDGAYHQGTTWAWLIGHFVQAHLSVYQNPNLARSFLEPFANHLSDGCIGNISEIFDGNVPFTHRGCYAQAWSVAEVLRSWALIHAN